MSRHVHVCLGSIDPCGKPIPFSRALLSCKSYQRQSQNCTDNDIFSTVLHFILCKTIVYSGEYTLAHIFISSMKLQERKYYLFGVSLLHLSNNWTSGLVCGHFSDVKTGCLPLMSHTLKMVGSYALQCPSQSLYIVPS